MCTQEFDLILHVGPQSPLSALVQISYSSRAATACEFFKLTLDCASCRILSTVEVLDQGVYKSSLANFQEISRTHLMTKLRRIFTLIEPPKYYNMT